MQNPITFRIINEKGKVASTSVRSNETFFGISTQVDFTKASDDRRKVKLNPVKHFPSIKSPLFGDSVSCNCMYDPSSLVIDVYGSVKAAKIERLDESCNPADEPPQLSAGFASIVVR